MSPLRSSRSLLPLTLLLLATAELSAQRPRGGWWIGAGGGMSRFRAECGPCGTPMEEDAPTGTFSFAFRPWRSVALSFDAAGLFGVAGDQMERQGSLTGMLRVYPIPAFPLFAEGGYGWAHLRMRFGSGPNSPYWQSKGAAFAYGLGGEMPVHRNLVLVPRFTILDPVDETLVVSGGGGAVIEHSYTVRTLSLGALYRIHVR